MKLKSMALSWFRKEDWPRWLEIDPLFQPDYDHWLRRMEATIRDLEAQGVTVVKVIIDPEEFVAWAGTDVSSPKRAEYAVMKANGWISQGPVH